MTFITYDHESQLGKKIFLVDMCHELHKPYSELVQRGISKFLAEGKRILVIAPKKGFASGIICNECGHIPQCEQCDVSIAVHHTQTGDAFGLCHICKRQYNIGDDCRQCGGIDTAMYGLGTQQVAKRIQERFDVVPCVVDTSDVSSLKKIDRVTSEISGARIVVATSILSTPPANRSADCVVVLHADGGLSIPDFQAARKTFCSLHDIFSHWSAPVFLVQSYNVEHRAIVNACLMDVERMRESEDRYRQQYGYPPYGDICLLLYKNEIEERLHATINKLYQELLFLKQTYEMSDLELYTAPPMIYKMFGKYRYSIVLKGPQLKQFMDIVFSKLELTKRGFKVDREPQELV